MLELYLESAITWLVKLQVASCRLLLWDATPWKNQCFGCCKDGSSYFEAFEVPYFVRPSAMFGRLTTLLALPDGFTISGSLPSWVVTDSELLWLSLFLILGNDVVHFSCMHMCMCFPIHVHTCNTYIYIYFFISLFIYLIYIYDYICTYVYFVCVSSALKKGACDDSVYILAWDSLQIPFSFFVFLIAYDCLVLWLLLRFCGILPTHGLRGDWDGAGALECLVCWTWATIDHLPHDKKRYVAGCSRALVGCIVSILLEAAKPAKIIFRKIKTYDIFE